jgi:hypothetical protein
MVLPAPESVAGVGLTPVMGELAREEARALSLRGIRPPVKVPGYEQEAFLGKGAYGEVWVAVDSNSGRKVAIKYYTRRGGTDWAALAREVEKLRYLFNDRYVVQLFKVGWEAEPPYYVMEYMENGSLEDLLRAGPLAVHDAVPLFRDIARGLVHAHDKGILHCDLKPANVLLDQDRHPRLADFGQSRLTNELSPALGTLFYMAPEQADLKSAPDARWDVYSLGAVMYRMLTGNPPHRADAGSNSVLASGTLDAQLAAYRSLLEKSEPPMLHRKAPGMDAGLAAIVSRCLAPNPKERFHNPQEVLTALETWNLRRARKPLFWLTGVTFAALVAIMAVIGTLLFRDTVTTAEREVVDEALEGNRFAAKSAAERYGVQSQMRWQSLEHAARDSQLRKWLATPPDELRGADLDAWLAERKRLFDSRVDDPSIVWFAVNRAGLQYGTAPSYPDHRFQPRGFRDYFHGRGKELEPQSPVPPPITRPTLSSVFKRKIHAGDEYWSVAFSVPVWPNDGATSDPIGVLGMNLDLKGDTRVSGDRERFAVLIDTRPDATGRRGLILRHPYLDRYRDAPPGGPIPLHYADAVVKWYDSGNEEIAEERSYSDPVGGEFGGPWLASVERVMAKVDGGAPRDTGWVVLIEERRDDVLKPVRALQWRLGYGAAAALAFIVVLVLLMWVGMLYVIDTSSRSRVTRMLRRWAGLPMATAATRTGGTPGTPGTSITGTSGSGTYPALPPPP